MAHQNLNVFVLKVHLSQMSLLSSVFRIVFDPLSSIWRHTICGTWLNIGQRFLTNLHAMNHPLFGLLYRFFLIYHLGNSEVFLCLGICVEIQICKYLHSSYSCSQKKLTPPPFSSHYTRVTTQYTQCDHHHSFMQSNFQSLNHNQMSWLFWFFIFLYFHSNNRHLYLKCSPSLKETFRRDRNIFASWITPLDFSKLLRQVEQRYACIKFI